jgi:hypothetical protein
MPLKLGPTGLGSGIDKNRPDYAVFSGEWEIGRIYQTRGGPDSLRWFWSLTVNGPMTRSDRSASPGIGQGAISEELGRSEGVGEAGGDTVTRIEQAIRNQTRRALHCGPRRPWPCLRSAS